MTKESDGGTAAGGPEESGLGADLQPGDMVGKFRILEKIGEGGFGTVYKAVNDIDKLGAVKVLRHMYSADPEMVSRFKAEARAVNQIRHRNIIDIFEFGKLEDGRQYYIMEYLDGMPLDRYLDERGRLSLADAIPILSCVARALDAAHAKGIAHRDLKPENALLMNDDSGALEAKLLDFGIAKLLREQSTAHKTRTGAPIGTPYYMSPEQARGRDVDHRTDIYAFGCVSYEMLTGEHPFDGEDYMEILLKQISEEPRPPSEIVPELPDEVDRAIAWMLRKNPSERPPNLVTAVRALEDAAVAAGVKLPVRTEPSGVYGSATAPLISQGTPSSVTPLPGSTGAALGTAETLATDSVELPPTIESRGGPRGFLIAVALVGAVAAGVVAFMIFSAGGDAGGAEEAAAPADPEHEGVAEEAPPAQEAEPAEAEPAEAEPTEEEPPPAPAFVTLEVLGPPPGTEVFGPGGTPLGVAPGKIQVRRGERPVILTFKADRHRTASREVVPAEDRTLDVELERRRRSRRGAHKGRRGRKGKKEGKGSGEDSGRNTIEDPF